MMRPGLTLVETLVALALLATLATTTAVFSTNAVGTARSASERGAWEVAARRSLVIIERDITSWDLRLNPDPKIEPDRLAIVGSTLEVLTRAQTGYPDRVTYQVDSEARLVRRSEIDGEAVGRVLIGDVSDLSMDISDENQLITIRIVSETGLAVAHSVLIPGVQR